MFFVEINYKQIKCFVDFDGTITIDDVGDSFFRKFSRFDEYITLLIKNEISIEEYYYSVCAFLPKELTESDIIEFAGGFEIDPNFKRFVDYCDSRNLPVLIISDGFDIYIRSILERYGLKTNFSANSLSGFGEKIIPLFNSASESCTCPSASCKRNIMLNELGPDDLAVYIGDGLSDFCAASHADIVFAKNSLAAHCNKMKIPHHPYSNFFDVYRILDNLIKKGKIKKRHQAELLKKKAYETE